MEDGNYNQVMDDTPPLSQPEDIDVDSSVKNSSENYYT